jgi:hypothetical protein
VSELSKLLRRARRAGIEVEPTRNSHFRLRLADGHIETIGSTPREATLSALIRIIREHEMGRVP